jgi:hypothetical protein
MSETIEMVYSACIAWFNDWVDADRPALDDEYDLSEWMENEMTVATQVFLTHAFHTPRARNDAIIILRALYYEYFLFRQQLAVARLKPNPAAAARLPTAPQTPQKSVAWHAESRNMLSGHEFGGVVLGSAAEHAACVAKKCAAPAVIDESCTDSQTVFLTPEAGLSPFKWGWRYEPVARDIFACCFAEGGAVNDELGRVRHSSLPRLGASPDGLVVNGPRSGRLVEIKCPISREINGTIPMKYWVQMQLQAEVCDVDAVEYIEVQFGASTTPDALHASTLPYVGKVCVVAESADAPSSSYKYSYSPLFPRDDAGIAACIVWVPPPQATADASTAECVLETSYWWVKSHYHTTVLRNPRWWATVGQPAYETFWETVEAARADGRYAARPLFVDTDSDSERGCDVLDEVVADAEPEDAVADAEPEDAVAETTEEAEEAPGPEDEEE